MSTVGGEVSRKRKAVTESADALDDGLEYEVDSDAAAADIASIESGSDDEDENADLDVSSETTQIKKKGVSRTEARRKRKARKEVTKKRKLEERGGEEGEETGNGGASDGAGSMHVDQQADLFARLIRDNVSKDLSSIELSDLTLPASSFLDTSTFTSPRTLTSLTSFITAFTHREALSSSNKEPGRPHTLLLASSAIRVADLTRSLKHLKSKTAEPAKLFGKEKIATQVAYLAKTRINVAIGVPGRVSSLVTQQALKLERVEQIYLDYTYRDSKKRGILQIKEVLKDLVDILTSETLKKRIGDGECHIVLF